MPTQYSEYGIGFPSPGGMEFDKHAFEHLTLSAWNSEVVPLLVIGPDVMLCIGTAFNISPDDVWVMAAHVIDEALDVARDSPGSDVALLWTGSGGPAGGRPNWTPTSAQRRITGLSTSTTTTSAKWSGSGSSSAWPERPGSESVVALGHRRGRRGGSWSSTTMAAAPRIQRARNCNPRRRADAIHIHSSPNHLQACLAGVYEKSGVSLHKLSTACCTWRGA